MGKNNICEMDFNDDSTRELRLSYEEVDSNITSLLGEILTIIDGGIIDKQQNKALKDLIKNKFYGQLEWIRKIAFRDYGDIVTNDKGKRLKTIEEIERSKN